MEKEYQSFADACNHCADACDHCATACLEEDNVSLLANCIATDIDCAAICRAAAGAVARKSSSAPAFCRLCAEICEKCAEECSKHNHDHCRECAEACRKCAEECLIVAS